MSEQTAPDRATFGVLRTGDGALHPHPSEGPVLSRAFELFLEHRRKKTVARLLNESGQRTRSGAPFSDTSIGRLLRNPAAKAAGVVSDVVWDDVQRILDDQASSAALPRSARHLLSGYVRCECGEPMYPKPPGGKYLCAKCRRKIPHDDLEAIFLHGLRSSPLVPAELHDVWEQLAFPEKRTVVEATIETIVVGDAITITLLG